MGMEGFRPSQALSYTDPLSHLDAAARAAEQLRKASAIPQDDGVEGVQPDPRQKEESKQEFQQRKPDDEVPMAEDVQEMLLTHFKITLDPNIIYHFDYNEQNDKIELLDTSSGKILLQIEPAEFIRISSTMRRNSGIMTDRSA